MGAQTSLNRRLARVLISHYFGIRACMVVGWENNSKTLEAKIYSQTLSFEIKNTIDSQILSINCDLRSIL